MNLKKATLFDVCRHTGLSTATVSRVLNNASNVTAETRSRVERAMAELGYVPNYAARALAGQRQRMLGVVFPEIGPGFWAEILMGLDSAAADNRYHLLTAFSHGGDDERDLVLRLLREGRIDALVVMNLRLSDEFAAEIERLTIPLVLIDRPVPELDASSVTIDNIGGASMALSHLFNHGHRDVALMIGDAQTYDSQQRLEGCRRAVVAAGGRWNDDLVWPGAFTEESGRDLMARWLATGRKPPRALFCFNDNLAIGAMDVLREKGYDVPRDVAIVGFDDVAAARHLGLTSVHVPMRDIGRAAATMAIDGIAGKDFERHVVVPTSLIPRRSCGCQQVPH